MAKIYDINSFESHLISRGLAKNSIIAFVSDVKQFLDSNLDEFNSLRGRVYTGYEKEVDPNVRCGYLQRRKKGCS